MAGKKLFIFLLVGLFTVLSWCDEEVFRWYESYNNGINLFEEKKFKDAIDEFYLVMYSRVGDKNDGIDKDIDRVVRTHSAAGASWIYYRPNLYIGVAYYQLGLVEKEKKEKSDYDGMREYFNSALESLTRSFESAPTVPDSRKTPDINFYLKKVNEELSAMQKADENFNKGVELFNQKKYAEAQKEFESVLVLYPNYSEADQYLDNIKYGKEIESKISTIADVIKPTSSAVSKQELVKKEILKTLQDNVKQLEQFFIEKNYNKVVSQGEVLMQKDFISDAFYKNAKNSIENKIKEAREKLAEIEKSVKDHVMASQKAKELPDKIKELKSALQLAPESKEAKKELAKVKSGITAKVNELYFKGIEYYAEDKLDKAINVWKQVLDLDSTHSRTQIALAKAENRLKILQGIK